MDILLTSEWPQGVTNEATPPVSDRLACDDHVTMVARRELMLLGRDHYQWLEWYQSSSHDITSLADYSYSMKESLTGRLLHYHYTSRL